MVNRLTFTADAQNRTVVFAVVTMPPQAAAMLATERVVDDCAPVVTKRNVCPTVMTVWRIGGMAGVLAPALRARMGLADFLPDLVPFDLRDPARPPDSGAPRTRRSD